MFVTNVKKISLNSTVTNHRTQTEKLKKSLLT